MKYIHCSCGAVLGYTVPIPEQWARMWAAMHPIGPDHKPTSAKQASQVRRRCDCDDCNQRRERV